MLKMPNVQQKKLNKGSVLALGFIAAMVAIMFLKINFWIKIAADTALILLFLFIRRGYIYLYLGSNAFRANKLDKAWNNLEKALKAGVDYERKAMIGSAFIQKGDALRGIEILENVMNDPKAGNFANIAAVTCSMGYWRLDDKDKAIRVLEELKATGYRDDNLSINLESYYLERGELKKAKAAIADGRKNSTENNGLLDNRGWYYIQTGNWSKAAEVYSELIDDRNAKFPEAYLHGAQVSIHNGDVSQAIDRLGWGTSKRFSEMCLTSKSYIEKLLLGLENPKTREEFAKAMDSAYVDVSSSRDFKGLETAVEFDSEGEDVIKPHEKPVYAKAEEKTSAIEENDDDDREPNTELDDSDAELARMYGDEEEDYAVESEEGPNTLITDDDDREPNTELDEND